ncbi:MAG: chromosomal replication initiator protein DnaA [Phycisphaerae bacterium]
MSDGTAIAWPDLLRTFRADFPGLYRNWLEQISDATLAAGEWRVVVADPIQLGYLRDTCREAFARSAMTLTGRLVGVRFVTPDDALTATATSAEERVSSQAPLNPDYMFEQFVVGPSNRLAHAACRAVCSQPGTLYNPLFIHGPSGLGKTHLLQAIRAELTRAASPLTAVYLTCETFVNEFVRAIGEGRLAEFRDAVRRPDVVIIDDVQFLANRETSQEELFHTFNVLYQSRRQIVLSADLPPAEIPTLEDRLVSRFNWGLVAHIDVPTRETRQAILQKKALLRGCEIPDEVLDYIAERVQSNVRLLEGALTKLISESQLAERPVTLETAREILEGVAQVTKPLQVADILQAVSAHYGLRLPELIGRRRSRSVAQPRQIGMYLARKLTPLSLEEIGAHFGGRDHSTVLHAEQVVESNRQHDPAVADALAVLTRRLMARR